MESSKYLQIWRSFSSGTGIALLIVMVLGTFIDKNPLVTIGLCLLVFGVANALFGGVYLLLVKQK